MTKIRKAAAKGLAALGVAGLAVAGAAGAAFAAQGVDGTAPGNAEEGTTGTLIIHKHAGTASGDLNNGTEQNVDRPPLAGVTFEICRVDGIDLTTEAGWTAAQEKTPENSMCVDGTTETRTTAADGTATFAGLEIGLYKVTETAVPEGVTPLSDSFLVSIPYPSTSGAGDEATSTWLWTVNVYPKNTLEGDGEKEVGDPSANGLGSTVPWTITTRPLGSFNGGAPLETYKVKDSLDSRLTYVSGSAKVYVVTPAGTETPLDDGYTLTAPTGAGGELIVDFDVDYVNGLPAGTTFKITFDTTVTSVGSGTIENEATEWTNDDEADFTTNVVTTEWGQAKLLKHGVKDESKVLSGAKFTVHDVNADRTCTAPLENAALTVSGESVFTSDSEGIVDIPGLYVGKNGEPASRDYCVVETAAPAGYVTNRTPIKITVTPGAVADSEYSAKVPNVPTKGPELPLTGANGTTLMVVGGVALVAIAGGIYLATRRKAIQE